MKEGRKGRKTEEKRKNEKGREKLLGVREGRNIKQ